MVIETIEFQVLLFINSLYGGLIGGFIYDIYKGSRYLREPGKIRTFVEDLIFWIIMALLAFYLFMRTSFGYIRGFVFIGFFLGSFLYLKILSRFLYPIILDALKLIKNIITFPFKLVKKILKPFKKIGRKIKNSYFQYKRLKKLSSRKK